MGMGANIRLQNANIRLQKGYCVSKSSLKFKAFYLTLKLLVIGAPSAIK